MRRPASGTLIETAFWLGFAVAAYAFTFSFDRNIEIYRFGAAGWPRAVILLMALTALFQLVQSRRAHREVRSEPDAETGSTDPESAGRTAATRDAGYLPRIALTLLLPLVYAASLDYTGFYVTTPVFLALYLFILGERRTRFLVLVPLIIYLLLLLAFTKLLFINLPVGNWHPFYDISHWLLVLLR